MRKQFFFFCCLNTFFFLQLEGILCFLVICASFSKTSKHHQTSHRLTHMDRNDLPSHRLHYSAVDSIKYCTKSPGKMLLIKKKKSNNLFCQQCSALVPVLSVGSDEVFSWASTNSPAMWQLVALQDAPQQLTSHPRQSHARYCVPHKKKRWFIWTMWLYCWWALTAQVCQRHLCCAHNRREANLPGYGHDFESSALYARDITHPETTRGHSNNTCHMIMYRFFTTANRKQSYCSALWVNIRFIKRQFM